MSSDILNQFQNLKKDIPDCKFVLPGSGETVFFKPFTTKDQKALLKAMEKDDYDLAQEAFDTLLNRCVTNDGFNALDLYPKDRESLLIALRKESVKDEYEDSWVCQHEIEDEDGKKRVCEHENTVEVKLSELDFTQLDKGSFVKEIVLTDRDNCTLVMDMAKRGDEKNVMGHAKKHSKGMKNTSRTELLHATMASFIKSIKMGEEEISDIPFADKVGVIDDLSMKDRALVQDYIKDLEKYGYELNIGEHVCEQCGHAAERELDWMYFFAL
jgi:hypothetical protein